jgi:hypothetical protein
MVNPFPEASPATAAFAENARAVPHVRELNCAAEAGAPASARPATRVAVDAASPCTIVVPPQCVSMENPPAVPLWA